MAHADRKHVKILHADPMRLLNERDSIGVADLVLDEYDCMAGPLLSRLSKGDGRPQISEFLRNELEKHFGLDPEGVDIDGMANRLGTLRHNLADFVDQEVRDPFEGTGL